MTEAEWLSCTDPAPMLEFLRGKVSDRKLRLFAVACCRRAWLALPIPVKEAVETVENFSEGSPRGVAEFPERVTHQPWWEHFCRPWRGLSYWQGSRHYPDLVAAVAELAEASQKATWAALAAKGLGLEPLLRRSRESSWQAAALRCLVGHPFRAVSPEPSWLTPTAVALAQAIYAEKAFDRLPILADALEEAGCDDPGILRHCREDGPHVRGCWIVDLILNKT